MSQPRRSLRLTETKPTNTTTARMIQMGRPGSKKVESASSPGRVGQQSRFSIDVDSPAQHNDYLDDDDPADDPLVEEMSGTVRHAGYRQLCLQFNDIHILNPSILLPATIKIHRTQFAQIVPKMPQLPPNTVASAIRELEELGLQCTEDDVADFWRKYIFPKSSESLPTGLTTKAGMHMARHLLPQLPTAPFPVQQPRPDLLYGYSFEAFTRIQLGTLISLYPEAPFGLLLPFLVIEYKAAGGTRGNLWVATNQCAGGSVASLQAAAYLNTTLRAGHNAGRFLNICYSLAIHNNLTLLYLSWIDDTGCFYVQQVDSLLLLRSEDFVRFRQCVLAILRWGAGKRLGNIHLALDEIMKARQEAATDDEEEEEEEKEGGRRKSKRRRRGL